MREIKFRAWEKFEEEYAEDMGVAGEMHYSNSWPDEEIQDKRTVVIPGFYHDSGWDSADFTVMQYTGLKDRNGKEIYEGDVMRILYTDWPSQRAEQNGRYSMSLEDYKKSISSIGYVQWENDRWVINFGKGRFGDDETGRMNEGPHGEKEVIGNLYENPELLPTHPTSEISD